MHPDSTHNVEETTDIELVRQWRTGSMGAFEALVRRYQPRVLAFLEPRLGNREDAKDVTQAAFLKLYRSLDRYRDRYPFSSWVFLIARRQAIDFHRRSGSRRRMQERLQTEAETPVAGSPGPDETLDRQERSETIWHWVRHHLSEQAFTVLWLSVQEEMSDVETARVMRLRPTHVRVILHRARKKLISIRASRHPDSSAADARPPPARSSWKPRESVPNRNRVPAAPETP